MRCQKEIAADLSQFQWTPAELRAIMEEFSIKAAKKAAKKAVEKAMDQFIATQGRKSPLNAPARFCSPACSPVWDNSPIRRPPRQERSP